MWEALAAKAVGDLAGGLGKGLGSAFGGTAGPFMGGAAEAMTYGTTLDGSGWIVNLGGQQIASASPTRTVSDYLPGAPTQAGGMLLPVLVFGGALAFYFLRKRRRK